MSSPCHTEVTLPEKELTVPKPTRRGDCREEKDIPEETEETKTYGLALAGVAQWIECWPEN